MANRERLQNGVNSFFNNSYTITKGQVIPSVSDIQLGKSGKEMELAMMFIDIQKSTKIVDGFRRVTSARMYKSFLWGVTKIVKDNNGELRSFNGDGVLSVFIGNRKRTNIVKASMQIVWFIRNILKPKVESYFNNNQKLQDLNFDFGIGVDVGQVLVVRGGIKGENNNDLVWVGNATNYAVKFSSLSKDGYNIYISKDIYQYMNDETKYNNGDSENMWESRTWTANNDMDIYRTKFGWVIN